MEYIANQRLKFDEQLKKIKGIKFFLSCISGTTSNNEGDGDGSRPCISYFIVYNNEMIKEDEIFGAYHDNQLDPELKKVGSKKKTTQDKADIMRELKLVIKVNKCQYFFENYLTRQCSNNMLLK